MKLGRLNHIGVAITKPLPFRGGVGVGTLGKNSLGGWSPPPAPPLKGRGEVR